VSKFQEGDWVLACDKKHRQRMFVIRKGKLFSLYNKQFKHDILIGLEEGSALFADSSQPVYVFRPSMRDYVMNMKRNVQPIYPKDLGLMVFYADLRPGSKVLEIGLGAGALSLAILNAIGPSGELITYERRQDFAKQGKDRIEAFLGICDNHKVVIRDASESIDEKGFDSAFIDVPEPWSVVENVCNSVKNGAYVMAFIPTTVQIKQYWDFVDKMRCVSQVEIFETMFRKWDVGRRSLRPAHTMIGHTGFVVVFRKVSLAEKV